MRTRPLLVAISAAQLAVGVTGQIVALRQGRSFDVAVLRWRGEPARITHDSWLLGTGLSAPVAVMVVQAAATAALAARPSRRDEGTLGALGAAMAAGYLIESDVRGAMGPSGWDPVVTPVAGVGLTLAVAMGAVGLRGASTRHTGPPEGTEDPGARAPTRLA